MVNFLNSTILLIVVVLLFLAVDIIMAMLIWGQGNKLSRCESFQNSQCAVMMCNGNSDTGVAPTSEQETAAGLGPQSATISGNTPSSCWPYAFRDIRDEAGNLVDIQCDYPFPGKTPLNANNK